MIPKDRYLIRLQNEREYWNKQDQTPFIQGIIRGLTMASQLADVLWKETRDHLQDNPRYLAVCQSHFKRFQTKKGGSHVKTNCTDI